MLRETGQKPQNDGLAGLEVAFDVECFGEIHLSLQMIGQKLLQNRLIEIDGQLKLLLANAEVRLVH